MEHSVILKKLEREKAARRQAEDLLEKKSAELFTTNTMLRSTADQLSMQTSQLNMILDNAMAGIILANHKDEIIRANLYAEAKFGYEPGTLFGRSVYEFIKCPPISYDGLELFDDQYDAEPVEEEVFAIDISGTSFPVELSVRETEIQDSRYTVWIFRDITQRKKKEKEQLRLELELRQAQKLESLGTLASGIAHEINTPIQFVGDNLNFLQDSFSDIVCFLEETQKSLPVTGHASDHENSDEGQLDFEFLKAEIPLALEQSLDGISRVREIVLSVRDFSHPGVQDNVLTDLNASIQSTITISKNKWKYIAELKFDLAADLPQISCVPGEIGQVILNLIINAAHAIEAAKLEEQGVIVVQTRSLADCVEMRIYDNGCGISEEHKSKIFDPFFTTKDVGKGTGQGLALAHNIIVQKHKGKIFFVTEPGKGTCFIIQLPKVLNDCSKAAIS